MLFLLYKSDGVEMFSFFMDFFGSELTVKLGSAVFIFKVADNYKAELSSELTGLQRRAAKFQY